MLKKTVEEAVSLRYHLRAMGVRVSKMTPIYCDNMGVVQSASNPGRTLNEKAVALSYHFVREHIANDVCEVRKVGTKDNCVYPFANALNSTDHKAFFYELQLN